MQCQHCRRIFYPPERVAELKCACGTVVRTIGISANTTVIRGPGTELAAIFLSVNIAERVNCNCKAIAAEMDREGVSGCRSKRDYFIDKLNKNASLYDWLEKLSSAVLFVQEPWFRINEPLGSCFDEAVRRAEENNYSPK